MPIHPLIITPLYPPAVGGAATYYSQIAAEMVGRDQIRALTILTERFPGQPRVRQEGNLALAPSALTPSTPPRTP